MELKLAPVLSEKEIAKKVAQMGEEITKKLNGEPAIAICVLRGSFIFFSDLIRQIDTDISCEFLGVSSYHNSTVSSGEVKVTLDLSTAVEGKNLIIIEDIVDTGLTMNFIKKILSTRKPKSILTVSLLEKPEALKEPCDIDILGFKIENDFVVGYGLDYQGKYRNLPYVARIENLL